MSRWRRIEQRMYADAKFRALSAPQPNAQTLWIWLITGPRTHVIPGVVIGQEAEMAGALGWPLEGFREAFREVHQQGMAVADWKAGLVWLPKGPHHQPPQSVNVVTSWGKEWEFVPECDLKLEIYQSLGVYLDGKGEAYAKAFGEAFEKPMPIQKQKQKQEQKQDLPPPASPPVVAPGSATADAPRESSAKAVEKASAKPHLCRRSASGDEKPTVATWNAYAAAYLERYGVEPTRNATVNGQLANFVARIGGEDAPAVARWFVAHPKAFYATKLHPVGVMLADAEGLHAEWKRGQYTTAHRAREQDRIASDADDWSRMIAEAEAREAAEGGGHG